MHTLRPLKLLCLHIPPCSGHLLNLEALLDPQFWNHWDIWFQWSSVTSYYTRLNSNKIKIKTFHLNIHTNTQNHVKSGKMFVNFYILAKPFQTCYMSTKVNFDGTKTNINWFIHTRLHKFRENLTPLPVTQSPFLTITDPIPHFGFVKFAKFVHLKSFLSVRFKYKPGYRPCDLL